MTFSIIGVNANCIINIDIVITVIIFIIIILLAIPISITIIRYFFLRSKHNFLSPIIVIYPIVTRYYFAHLILKPFLTFVEF